MKSSNGKSKYNKEYAKSFKTSTNTLGANPNKNGAETPGNTPDYNKQRNDFKTGAMFSGRKK